MRPYEGDLPYCFVSYAHADAKRIRPYLTEMQSRGARIWHDRGIDPGTEWAESIASRLLGSTLFIVFLSEASLSSKNVRREINFAVSKGKAILTLYLEPCEVSPGMQLQLGGSQYVRLDRYRSVVDAMDRAFVAVPDACLEGTPSGPPAPESTNPQNPVITHRSVLATAMVGTAIVLLVLGITFGWYLSSGDKENAQAGAVAQDTVDTAVDTTDAEDESEESQKTFPLHWHGSYEGHTTRTENGNEIVLRYIDMDFESVSADGVLSGTCVIESADLVDGHMRCSYSLAGNVDLESGDISVWGDEWIDQGNFSYMRRFDGKVNDEQSEISGTSADLDGTFESSWKMEAIS